MRKHHFLVEKLLLFLFYLETLVMLEDHHKPYFWVVIAAVALASWTLEGARPYTPIFLLILIFDYFELTVLQSSCVVVLGLLMVYLKFYHI
jgi:hypothetical protein